MFYLKNALKRHGNIEVGIVGTGLMGTSLLNQLYLLDNFTPRVVSSRRMESVLKAFELAKISKEKIFETNNIEEAINAKKNGYYIATTNNEIPASINDCVVDCTGNTEAGARISLCAIENNVNIVSLNVEMDATVGYYLKYLADKKNIIYSGSAGDEPGAILELYDFLNTLGFEVLVLGKGKNNILDNYATVESLTEEAISKRLNPKMLTSFVDGTNTMIELNAVCNATGFLPDIRGCHFFHSSIDEITEKIKTKNQGGILNNYKIVDFVKGVAPGVFAIVKCKSDILNYEMEYLKMGKGPNYVIYRPFHLTSLETPESIIRAVVLKDSTIAPIKQYADTVAIAKKDLYSGELIDGIGGDCVYGTLETHENQKKLNLLPIGLIVGIVKIKRNIKKGEALTYDDVVLDENSAIVKLRNLQNKILKNS